MPIDGGWLPAARRGWSRRSRRRFVHGEVDRGDGALPGILDLPELRGSGVGQAGNQIGGELHLPGVVLGGDVVVELPGKSDLVLRAGEFLLELGDITRRLQ